MKRLILSLITASLLATVLIAAEFSPWDAWRQAYLAYEKGEQNREKGDYLTGLRFYKEARDNYLQVRKARPDWNQKIIQSRINDCEQAIKSLSQLLGDDAHSLTPAEPELPRYTPSQSERIGTMQTTRVKELESEVEKYRQKLLDTLVEVEDLRRQLAQNKAGAEEIANLLRDQRVMQEKYALLQRRYESLEQQALEPDSRLTELRNQLVEEKLNTETLRKRLQLAESQIKKNDQENVELVQQRNAAERTNKLKDAEITRLQRENSELTRVQNNALEQGKQQQQKVDQIAIQLRDSETRMQALTLELNTVRKQLQESITQGGDSNGLNAKLLAENEKLRQQLAASRSASDTESEQNLRAQARLREVQMELLQVRETMQKLENIRAKQAEELATLKKGIERDINASELTATELKNLRERNRQLENDINTWSERNAKLEQRLTNLNSDAFRRASEADAARRDLATELDQLKGKFSVLTARSEQLEEARLNAEKQMQADHAALLKERSARLAAEEEAKKLRPLQTQVAELLSLQNEKNSLEQNFKALQKEAERYRTRLAELTTQEEKWSRTAEKLTQLQRLQEEVTRLQRLNQQLTEAGQAAGVALPGPELPVPQLPSMLKEFVPPQRTVSSIGTPAELLAAAREAEAQDSFELAVWNYQTVLDLDPSNAEAAAGLGQLYLKREEFARAEPLLVQARLQKPQAADLILANARALIGLEKFGNALTLLEPLLKTEQNNPEFLLAMAAAYAGCNQPQPAETLLQQAVRLSPSAPQPRRELARLLLRTAPDRKNEAARFYQESRDRGAAPDAELEPQLGKLLAEQRELTDFMLSAAQEAEGNGDWDSAAWYYRQLLDADQASTSLPIHLAFCFYQQQQYPAALEVLSVNAPSPTGVLLSALIQFHQGDFAAAEKTAKRARQLNQNQPFDLKEQPLLKNALMLALQNTAPEADAASAALRAAL